MLVLSLKEPPEEPEEKTQEAREQAKLKYHPKNNGWIMSLDYSLCGKDCAWCGKCWQNHWY